MLYAYINIQSNEMFSIQCPKFDSFRTYEILIVYKLTYWKLLNLFLKSLNENWVKVDF